PLVDDHVVTRQGGASMGTGRRTGNPGIPGDANDCNGGQGTGGHRCPDFRWSHGCSVLRGAIARFASNSITTHGHVNPILGKPCYLGLWDHDWLWRRGIARWTAG